MGRVSDGAVMPLGGRPGLPRTHVVHPWFEQHHRPVSEDEMPAECLIIRQTSGPATFNETAGRSTLPTPTVVYEGPCRFHRGGQPGGSEAAGATVADRQVALGAYTVTIPTGTDLVQAGDIVTITACAGDPDAVDKPMQVLGARRSALTWERVLSVQMQQPVTP